MVFALMVGSAVGNLAVSATLLAIPIALRYFGVQMPSGLAFMAVFDPTDLTWNGKEAMGLSEAIYEKAFMDVKNPLSNLHTIVPGIKAKQQIPFLGQLGLVGKKKTACDVTPNSGGVTSTEKFWQPAFVSDRLSECFDTYKASFFTWALGNNLKKEDLEGTDVSNFLETVYGQAIAESVWRNVWFGDTAADDSSAGGHLTTGTDEAFFTPIDGIWKQIFTAVTGDSTLKISTTAGARITTLNAASSYSAQAFQSADLTNKTATNLFQELKFGADMRLRDDPSGFIMCTQSIMDQYEKERSSQNLESGITILENGLGTVKVGGITVISVPFWDRYINAYFNTGAKWYLPHRAVYTTKANIPVGVEEEGSMANIDAFTDKVNKKYILDFAYNIDAKLLENYMAKFAY